MSNVLLMFFPCLVLNTKLSLSFFLISVSDKPNVLSLISSSLK